MTLTRMHRLSGAILGSFVLLHLFNHLFVLAGASQHIALMEQLRTVYRWPPLEALLLACVLFQVCSGPVLLRGRGLLARATGLYMLFFLLVHTLAVLWSRAVPKVDTDIYFAAAGLHSWPAVLFFLPYYLLAVVAVCAHLGNALSKRFGQRHIMLPGAAAIGLLAGALIVGGMMALEMPNPNA